MKEASKRQPSVCPTIEAAAIRILSNLSQRKVESDLKYTGLQLNLTDDNRSFAVGSRLFANLPVSYNAFTVYSHQQLDEFSHSALFDRDEAMTLTDKERPRDVGERIQSLGYPERAANGFSYFKVPKGFTSSMLVPYDALTMQLDMAAGIWHMTNKYAASGFHTGPSSVKVHDFLLT